MEEAESFEDGSDVPEESSMSERDVHKLLRKLAMKVIRNTGLKCNYTLEDLFQDRFYIDIFKIKFPQFDYEDLESIVIDHQDRDLESIEIDKEIHMVRNLQSLINLLEEQILKMDMSHITAEEIINGNAE